MGLWNTEFGGAVWEGVQPPDFEPFTFDGWDIVAPQLLDAGGANNTGTYVFTAEDNNAAESLMRWTRVEDLDDCTDTDQLILFRSTETPSNYMQTLWCRASGASGTENGYSCAIRQFVSPDIYLYEYTAGTPTTLVSSLDLPNIGDFLINTWYWFQFRVVGDSLKVRAWPYGDAVPAWQIDTTDSTHTAAGFTGFGSNSTMNMEWDWYSVATEGDHPQFFDNTPVAPSNDNTLVAIPSSVQTDGTSFLIYTGAPDVTVEWTLTGDGTLTVLSDVTDAGGKAWARYTPGTVGPHNVDVEVGIAV